MDSITRKILERIEAGLSESGIEYCCDINPVNTTVFGAKIGGYVGSFYTLTSDLTVDRKLEFVRVGGTLTFNEVTGTKLVACKPGESFGESHFSYVDAPVLVDRVVRYMTTGEIVRGSHQHEWGDRDINGLGARCNKCGIVESVAAD